MSRADRRAYGRRLRLEWASQNDLAHAAAVQRMIDDGERIATRRGRPS